MKQSLKPAVIDSGLVVLFWWLVGWFLVVLLLLLFLRQDFNLGWP